MNDPEHIWRACATSIKTQVADAVWQSTFRDLQPLEVTDGAFWVQVPSTIVRDRIERRYRSLLEDVLGEVTGEPLRAVIEVAATAVLEATPTTDGLDPADPTPAPRAAPAAARGANGGDSVFDDELLISRYTFERFVCGPSNFFTHAAALQVAEQPGRVYNPLFIYGGAGLGKTHLLHATAHYIHQHYPTALVRVVSTESFLNRFVYAIRSNQLPRFKDHYRRINVLLVDDAQFFAGKEGLQEEFFYTFNTLYEASGQLVITCDRPPDSIPTLEDRLRSRFKMGLITDIQPPNIETRLAILDQRIPGDCRELLSDKVLEFIAERVTNNIRELEGALTQVCAFAAINNERVSVSTTEGLLRDIYVPHKQQIVTPTHVLAAVSSMFGISVEEITGTSRRRQLVAARHIAMYVIRDLTDLSFPAIATGFSNRDHTTVIHAVNKIKELMSERQQVYEQVTQLIRTLRSNLVAAA